MIEKLDVYNSKKERTGKIIERIPGVTLEKRRVYNFCSMLDCEFTR